MVSKALENWGKWSWEMGNKQDEPHDCSFCLEELLSYARGNPCRAQWVPWLETKRLGKPRCLEFTGQRIVKGRAKEGIPEICRWSASSIQHSTGQHVCEWKNRRSGNDMKGLKGAIQNAHRGLGIKPIATTYAKKPGKL